VLEVVGVTAAVVYAGVTIVQLYDLRHSIEMNNRAWVGLDRPVDVTAFSFGPKEGKASYIVTLKNYGPSVAQHIAISAHVSTNIAEVVAQQLQACKEAEATSNGWFQAPAQHFGEHLVGDTLFPSDAEGRHFDNQTFNPYGTAAPNVLTVTGCVVYRDQFGKQRRTRFCYWYFGNPTQIPYPTFLYQAIGLNDAN
jgi:hypothetical protein